MSENNSNGKKGGLFGSLISKCCHLRVALECQYICKFLGCCQFRSKVRPLSNLDNNNEVEST